MDMTSRVLKVRILGGEHGGKIAFIPRLNLTPSNESTWTHSTLRLAARADHMVHCR
jgi:hypothetical protein